jgi:hypothetical protein
MPEPDAVAPDGSLIYYRVGDARRASLVEVVLPAGAVLLIGGEKQEPVDSLVRGDGADSRPPL